MINILKTKREPFEDGMTARERLLADPKTETTKFNHLANSEISGSEHPGSIWKSNEEETPDKAAPGELSVKLVPASSKGLVPDARKSGIERMDKRIDDAPENKKARTPSNQGFKALEGRAQKIARAEVEFFLDRHFKAIAEASIKEILAAYFDGRAK